MPSRKQIASQLLDSANAEVTKRVKAELQGKYAVMVSNGWKDDSRNLVSGVNLSVDGKVRVSLHCCALNTHHLPTKTYLVDLILANAHRKDGASMCEAFGGMIDRAEDLYRVRIVAFCCDNDGGSQQGRKDLVLKRPWLFGPPCCAHQVNRIPILIYRIGANHTLQFQLILGDYFTENKEAAETAEEATDLIGWVLNHGFVRSIFNETQAEISTPPGKVLAFLVANMTRWNTHFIAFDCLFDLKDPMRRVVIS